MHNLGRKSYASLRYELQQEDPNKQEPSQTKVYKESRKRTHGRTYLTDNEKTREYIEKMNALESAQHGEGDNSKDPYSQVIPEPKRKSRVRLVGSGVTKNDVQKRDKGSGLIFPEEMKADLVKQLMPSFATAILSQLQEANPGINIVIPESLSTSTPRDASSAPHHVSEQNGQSTKTGATVSQVQGEQSGEEI
ncbi:uncharacterized protein [Spinacia oleracea]|uniref:Uncharacterized protein n=1 Tax=Spinacia oleracea TaxID=3562 RepID=A0A9R0I7F9_SPIOL|nr:uncharacterized protein LOC110783809 [Spinacia oleracea]